MTKTTSGAISLIIALSLSLQGATTRAESPIDKPTTTPRIINGNKSKAASYPWMLALVNATIPDNFNSQFCGATLIHPNWALTAAHCVHSENSYTLYSSDEIEIFYGSNELDNNSGTRLSVKRIISHPEYNPTTQHNDIALLELSTTLPITPAKLPGQIYDTFFTTPEMLSTAIGWGQLSASEDIFPTALQEVSLPVVDQDLCRKIMNQYTVITDNVLCAGDGTGLRDTCQGDSGGPLLIKNTDGSWTQAGVTSTGFKCAQPSTFGLYTRVGQYSDWISKNICMDSERPTAPLISIQVEGNEAILDVSPVDKASGYRIYFAPTAQLSPIQQIDLDTATTISATLPGGTNLSVAVQPYDNACLGSFSEIKQIIIP